MRLTAAHRGDGTWIERSEGRGCSVDVVRARQNGVPGYRRVGIAARGLGHMRVQRNFGEKGFRHDGEEFRLGSVLEKTKFAGAKHGPRAGWRAGREHGSR